MRSTPEQVLGRCAQAGGDLQIRLLPHRLFARQCADERPTDPVVLHCYAEKVPAEKRFVLNASGAWFLRDDWDGGWDGSLRWLDWLRAAR